MTTVEIGSYVGIRYALELRDNGVRLSHLTQLIRGDGCGGIRTESIIGYNYTLVDDSLSKSGWDETIGTLQTQYLHHRT